MDNNGLPIQVFLTNFFLERKYGWRGAFGYIAFITFIFYEFNYLIGMIVFGCSSYGYGVYYLIKNSKELTDSDYESTTSDSSPAPRTEEEIITYNATCPLCNQVTSFQATKLSSGSKSINCCNGNCRKPIDLFPVIYANI